MYKSDKPVMMAILLFGPNREIMHVAVYSDTIIKFKQKLDHGQRHV